MVVSGAPMGGSGQRWAGEPVGWGAGRAGSRSHMAEAGTGRGSTLPSGPTQDLPPSPGSVPWTRAGPEVDLEAGAPGSHLKTSLLLTPGTGARTGRDLVWGRGRGG